MEFKSRIVTYGELRDGLHFDDDRYGIATYEYESRRKTFLANPNLCGDDDTFMYLVEADGIPVGRTMLFDTRLKMDDEIVPLYSGSSLKVAEEFWKYGFGSEIFSYGRTIKKRKRLLSAGISNMALPLYKVMKYNIFEFPKLLMLRDSKPILEKKGIRGGLLKLLVILINMVLHCFYSITSLKTSNLKKQFLLEKVSIVPEWIDNLTLHDGHKYAEAHDYKWLQWNLDYNFKGHRRDIQSFYIIRKDDQNIGFVMTKERYREKVHGMKDVMIGSVVEWGSADEKLLCESDIYRLSLSTFSKDVAIIEVATNDTATQKHLKRMGFMHHGDAHIAFKDKTKTMNDAGDASLWRLRYGYADVILT